ncbi:MAG: FAD-binding oxidoreductase [Puniceicoccaceae bacterium]|nr:MAG: FAD-binding oxidoreductase [Puniceicoccaceae bacterium]
MSSSPHTPYLIVGAGLAGCLLAWRLHQAGRRVHLVGSSALPAAYRVAAGVINPVTGRWMTKSWNIDTLLPIAQTTYRAIEAALGIRIYHPIPEIRFCQNADDLKRLGRRLRNPRYANVLGAYHPPGQACPLFTDPHGAFAIEGAAYVDLPKLVGAVQQFFQREGCYQDAPFRYAALRPSGPAWQYGDITTEAVIFCEGAAVKDNPWFGGRGLQAAKGETLLCRSPGLTLPNTLFHHTKWLLPYPDGCFRIGASYDEADLTETPTTAARANLLDAARSALRQSPPIEVVEHLAGIRPSTTDSRPMIGPHPEVAGLYCLNGLGSKGATSAPALSQQLTAHLLEQSPIEPEVDCRRFT